MNRIYFDLDNKAEIAAWLNKRPGGLWHVLIGSNENESDLVVTEVVTSIAIGCGKGTFEWYVKKMMAVEMVEMVVRASPRLDIPSGMALPTTNWAKRRGE